MLTINVVYFEYILYIVLSESIHIYIQYVVLSDIVLSVHMHILYSVLSESILDALSYWFVS